MDQNGRSKLETILKWIVLVILAVVALKVVFSVFALAWLVGGILLTKVLPLVLLVWLVLKVVEWWKSRNGGTPPVETEY
jgi:predicted signal transduction protein with EAL and GGDEF domain